MFVAKKGLKMVFTKKDLLVVLTCIVLLVVVSGSVGKRGRELGKRMICANNIRQLTAGLINYANENGGKMVYGGGFWPVDLPYDTVDVLLDSMGIEVEQPSITKDLSVQDVFYCPANLMQTFERDLYWRYSVSYDNARGRWDGCRVGGYIWLWAASWNTWYSGALPILGTGNKQWVSTIFIDNPEETELITDAIMSQTYNYDSKIYPNGNFGQITTGGISRDSSSHLKSLKEPYGGNIGFVDGHVEWRPFEQMQLRLPTLYRFDPNWWW
jgi:prepilin-type processing-associated H-X9-DG protein